MYFYSKSISILVNFSDFMGVRKYVFVMVIGRNVCVTERKHFNNCTCLPKRLDYSGYQTDDRIYVPIHIVLINIFIWYYVKIGNAKEKNQTCILRERKNLKNYALSNVNNRICLQVDDWYSYGNQNRYSHVSVNRR